MAFADQSTPIGTKFFCFLQRAHSPSPLYLINGTLNTELLRGGSPTVLGLEPIVNSGESAVVWAYLKDNKPVFTVQLRENGKPIKTQICNLDSKPATCHVSARTIIPGPGNLEVYCFGDNVK